MCVLLCCSRLPAWVNDLSHWSHWYVFSPVWNLSCILRDAACLNVFPHCLHSTGLLVAFTPLYSCTRPAWGKPFSHWLLWKSLPTVCVSWCSSRCSSSVNDTSHWLHWKFIELIAGLATTLVALITLNRIDPKILFPINELSRFAGFNLLNTTPELRP